MPRYIDAEKLQEQILELPTPMYRDELFPLIYALQTADVQEARHGKWEYDENIFPCFCSECGQEADMIYAFCPHCGARMDD